MTTRLSPQQMDHRKLEDLLKETHLGNTVTLDRPGWPRALSVRIVDVSITDDPALVYWATYARKDR